MKYVNHIYICSKGKPANVLTAQLLKAQGYSQFTTVISHDDDLQAYRANGKILQAPATCNNLSAKKEWIVKTQCKRGQWVLIVEDNIVKFTGASSSLVAKDINNMKKEITIQTVMDVVNNDIRQAEELGAILGGFASNDNPFFRKIQYRQVGFVWGKVMYIKNVGVQWLNNLNEMSDYAISALALLHSGRVVINNYIYPVSKRFQKVGGTGSYEKRIPHKQYAANFLVNTFKGLYRMVDRPGLAPNSEVRMRFNSIKQINTWRKTM